MLLLFGSAPACFALSVSNNPLVDPKGPVPFVETEDEFFNILIMGVDHGFKGYWGSGGKRKFENCHSDQNIVVSINLTKKQLNLISVPRDFITYIPGKQGIYKLNATFSCADTVEEGIQNVSNAVSWYLGGIQIDCYCVVNMETMVALGDAMGGIDFNVDMNYTGCSGTKYKNGMQHLDGLGIMEYVRARKNATVDGTDIGRTRRGRSMMIAIFKNCISSPNWFTIFSKSLKMSATRLLPTYPWINSFRKYCPPSSRWILIISALIFWKAVIAPPWSRRISISSGKTNASSCSKKYLVLMQKKFPISAISIPNGWWTKA